MFAYQQSYISPDSFLILSSFLLLTMVLVGGITSPAGAVFGGMALIVLPELLRGFLAYREFIYGVVLILVIKFLPSGVASVGYRADGTKSWRRRGGMTVKTGKP